MENLAHFVADATSEIFLKFFLADWSGLGKGSTADKALTGREPGLY
jgi:hypothetical protein